MFAYCMQPHSYLATLLTTERTSRTAYGPFNIIRYIPVELGGELCVVCIPLLLCEGLPAKSQRVLAQLLQQILLSERRNKSNVEGIIIRRTQLTVLSS
jgi:hypothetical protein